MDFRNHKNLLLLLVFAGLEIIGILHHELWLDEAHHWLFARDSESVKELLTNMQYDGHPILWNLLLFLITRFTTDVTLMQVLNVCISITAVALLLYYSPFNFLEKIFFTSGYFIVYEYTVISRNYALLMLLLFMTIIFYIRKRYVLLGLTLSLLSNTHLFGLAFSCFFTCMLGFELFFERNEKLSRSILIGGLIFLFGCVISLSQIIPPQDSNFYTIAQSSPPLERLARTSTIFLKALVPIPDFTDYHFWNSNLLMSVSKPLCVVLSLALLCVPLYLFKRRILLVLFFYSCSFFVAFFVYSSDLNAVRYYGMIYLILISCIWLNRSKPSLNPGTILKFLEFKQDYSHQFFIAILVVQSVAGVLSYTLDLARPFSESKNAATLILNDSEPGEYLSAGCGAAPVSAYLRQKVYYLNINKYGSFCQFGYSAVEDGERLKADAIGFTTRNHCAAFLISHIPLVLSQAETQYISLAGSFEKSVLRKESYFIYKVRGK